VTPQTVVIRPPGGQLADRVADAHRRYLAVIGNHRGCDPRQVVVEHRVARRASEVVAALCAVPTVHVEVEGRSLSADGGSVTYDSFELEHRLRASLRLRWSWPALPVWLSVSEQANGTCSLRLSLRRRHRIRYPSRYFHAAHSILDALADQGLSAL
jgi:hypothetical protein